MYNKRCSSRTSCAGLGVRLIVLNMKGKVMKKILKICGLSIVMLMVGCAGPMKMYQGNELPKNELGLVYFTNATGFLSEFYINVISLDDRDFLKEPYTYGQGYVAPGVHKMKVTFTDYDNYIIPVNLKQKQFQGYYEIEFEVLAGKKYAPIFNLNLEGREILAEMCVAEISQSDSFSKTRELRTYVGCGKPSIPPIEENIKLCQQWDWIAYPAKVYEEACRIISN